MKSRLLSQQDGAAALILLMALMVLAVPLVTSALGFASILSLDSLRKTYRMKSQYSSMSGSEHLTYRLRHEAGYADSLPIGIPSSYIITINGIDVTVTVLKTNTPPPPEAVPAGTNNRAFRIDKAVSPNTAPPDTPTSYTYTTVLSNMTEDTKTVTNIKDSFPDGLTYVTGSTSGITTTDPDMVSGDLRWNLTSTEGTLNPFTSKAMQFQMQGSLPEGVHCNDTWVSPGGDKTRSGLTAKITVGAPPTSLCPGTAIQLSKTVTPQVVPTDTPTTFEYTLSFVSDGENASNISKVIDLLPPTFSYVSGSTLGITTADPTIKVKNENQQELTWSANPIATINPGDTVTLSFEADATLEDASYYNEATATVSGLNYDLYTWPAAKIEAVGVFEVVGSDGETTNSSEVWLGSSGAVVQDWNVSIN